ncbi:unnamed protein product [Cercospora beticola]|nr:unnamed protein product [Cercospora beticola]
MLGLLAPISIPLERPSKCPWIRGPQYRGQHDSRLMRDARVSYVAVPIPNAMFQRLSRWPTETRSRFASNFRGSSTQSSVINWETSLMEKTQATKRDTNKGKWSLRRSSGCYLEQW